MQHTKPIEPRRVGAVEPSGISAIAEHRALTELIDQDDHGSGASATTNNDLDPTGTECCNENPTMGVVTDLTDEPRGSPGTNRTGGDIGRTAAASAQHDRARIGRHIDGSTESYHDVLDEVSYSSEHAADGTSMLRPSVWQSLSVDLQTWIAADYASIATRFESTIAHHVPIDRWKQTPPGAGSCIAGLLMHMTYHEDLALNTAIRNHAPLLDQHRDALGIDHLPKAAGLSETEDRALVDALRLEPLRSYVRAVTNATTEWLTHLSMMALDSVPSASWQLEHKAGLAPGGLEWLHAMWTDKPVSWFVQWECIGHRHGHLGEMIGVRGRLGLSPF